MLPTLGVRAAGLRLLLAARASVLVRLAVPRPGGAERRLHAGVAVAAAAAAAEGRSGGRPSKTAAKYEAKQFQAIARQLSRLTDKQLARLAPLVGDEIVDAVAVAARISHRNQGRQRQESLVAKLLRESVEETEVAQLQAAIESVKTGQGVIANPAVERQVQLWLAALLSGQGDVVTEVFGAAQNSGVDVQQLRQLSRQAQQTESAVVAAAATTAAEAAAVHSSSNDEAATAASAGAIDPPRPTAKVLAARRQLRKLLQPLAEAHLAVDEEEELV